MDYYRDELWHSLRKQAFETYGNMCMACGSEERLSVDHIYPVSKYPELKYEFKNLQILCLSCNARKGNRHTTDYRQIMERNTIKVKFERDENGFYKGTFVLPDSVKDKFKVG